ncbi:MAG: hypothetical protein QOG97_1108, partial [Acidimicrobiaceae bacterium]|nr:hypothetical protein [Acidimicrobiaceae bacterium]
MRLLRRFSILISIFAVFAIGLAGSASFNQATVTGQAVQLHSTMTGANEVPGPGDPNASGSTIVVL